MSAIDSAWTPHVYCWFPKDTDRRNVVSFLDRPDLDAVEEYTRSRMGLDDIFDGCQSYSEVVCRLCDSALSLAWACLKNHARIVAHEYFMNTEVSA